VLLLESPAYPWKCLTCGCLATTAFDQTRHNFKVYVKEIASVNVNWVPVVYDKNQWLALVNTELKRLNGR
jgi:hypothetical protein